MTNGRTHQPVRHPGAANCKNDNTYGIRQNHQHDGFNKPGRHLWASPELALAISSSIIHENGTRFSPQSLANRSCCTPSPGGPGDKKERTSIYATKFATNTRAKTCPIFFISCFLISCRQPPHSTQVNSSSNSSSNTTTTIHPCINARHK